jgi:hypothetical protein
MEVSPGRFSPGGVAPGTQWIGGWVGPRTGLDFVKRKAPTLAGIRKPAIQPVAIPTEPSQFDMNKM